METIAAGMWQWSAPHPAWDERQDWAQRVTSFVIDDGERCIFVDPLAPTDSVLAHAHERTPVVLLTCPWHRRDGVQLAERLSAQVYVPPPDPPDPDPVPGTTYRAGDQVLPGVYAYAGAEPNDLVLWFERCGALVVGDSLIDRGSGLEFPVDWAARNGDADAIHASLLELLELPIEHVLLTHGGRYDRDALQRALAQPVAATS